VFKKALITARDLLVSEGERFRLEVEVERKILPFVDPAIPGVEVEVEGTGRVRTDASGRAFLELGPVSAGHHRYRVRLAGGAGEAEALVRAVPRGEPVFVADIDGTVSRGTSVGFALHGNSRVIPFEGAGEALGEIARRAAVAYLTARDHVLLAKTRDWLRSHAFPEGPVLLRRVRIWSASSRRHKIACLEELRSRGINLRWGIGDRRGDVEAYAAAGLAPILLRRRRPRWLAAEIPCVTRWEDVPPLVR